MSQAIIAAALALAVWVGQTGDSEAQKPRSEQSGLKKELAALAKQIQPEAAKYGDAVIMGEFTGPPELASSGGPGISQTLKVELEKLGVQVKRSARIAVKGEYKIVTDAASKLTVMAVLARIVDRNGKELLELRSRGVFDLTSIASVTGATMVVPPDASPKEREKAVDQALESIQKPTAKGTRISASRTSPYSIEILVGPDPGAGPPDLSKYRPRAPSFDGDGLAFLSIAKGEVYAVRVLNQSKHDAAVTLTVDGLNMFAFSDTPSYEFFILGAGAEGVIPGWHRTNQTSDAFQVDDYARSAAAEKLPNSSSIGTIHVSFKAAWPKGGTPPADEGESAAGASARSGLATGRGPAVAAKYEEVLRDVGRLREAVAVRYDKTAEPTDLPADAPPAKP
ncbi:hypothetical protein [Paludisphaera rhizosphaerae]|uniref:hypothetical protein n=1 Tax=Paludisphaera rhizosphaerae TaxID=2711216 RepID=UPI0013EA7E30|nr:hypothetical protein [Paludisphaera rhizosphaerae]